MSKESVTIANTIITTMGRLINTALIAGCIAYVAVNIKDIGVAWAGKTTQATVDVDVAASGKVEWGETGPHKEAKEDSGDNPLVTLCFFVGAGGLLVGLYGVNLAIRQRKLRQDTVTHLAPYKTMYEELVDQNRSTSGLMENGETRPEDKEWR